MKYKELVEQVLTEADNKVDALREFNNSLSPNKRYFITRNKQIKVSSVTQKGGTKPNGLWYSVGDEWFQWLLYDMPEWIYDFVFEVEINDRNVLKINNTKTFRNFEKQYLTVDRGGGFMIPDWKSVANDYSGIEIAPYLSQFRQEDWYYGWDVASGCIWNNKAVKKVSLIAEYDAVDKEYKYN